MPLRRALVAILALAISMFGLVTPAQAAVGDTTNFPLPANSAPFGAALGPDGNIWMPTGPTNQIAKITSTGTVTLYPVPTAASQPRFITAGPDGNMWFTEQAGNKIGRITMAGVITEFPIPTAGGEPYGIAAGPDGNLWFTELAGNKIGRITTAGVITEFPIPTANSQPWGISAGPNGSPFMYFTESNTDKIGIVTATGQITEIPLAAGSEPRGIMSTPTTVWFTSYGTNKLVQLQGNTPLEISLPVGSGPSAVAMGPGPSLWVSDSLSSKVLQFTAAGSLQGTFTMATNSTPMSLTQGSDGNIWVAMSGSSQAARVLSGQVPMSSAPPAITPTSGGVGTSFTASQGTWAYVPTTFTYQWQRCSSNAATSCTAIGGATNATYTSSTSDANQWLAVTVTATNLNGAGVPATSNLQQVTGTAPAPTPTPTPTPTPAPTPTVVTPTITVNAPTVIKRGKAKVIAVSVNPTTAAGTIRIVITAKGKSKTFANLPLTSGITRVSWKPAKKWPTGTSTVTATFVPNAGAPFASSVGRDTIRVKK